MGADTSTAITSAASKRRARANGAGSGPGAQVEDPARLAARQLAGPLDHVGQVRVQDLGVEVHELGQRRLVRPGPGMMLVMVVVMALHGSTLRPVCVDGIVSCV